MASKKNKIETSKNEQVRLLSKAKLKKTVKNASQRLSRKYGKNWELNAKVINDPAYKKIASYPLNLEDLETVPKRFKELTAYLKKQKNLNVAPDDLKTIYKALELAEKHQKQVNEIFRLQVEIVSSLVKGYAVEAKEVRAKGRLTKEGRAKGVRAFVNATRFKTKKPGKQSKWTKEDEKKLKERWYTLDEKIDKNSGKKLVRKQKLEVLGILKNEFPFESPDAVVQKLRELKVKEIPDVKYRPTK